MKKLIIAAAAIAMGASVFAAAAPWKATTTNIFKRNTTDKYAGTIYYFDSAVYSMSTVFDNMVKGDWTDLSSYAAGSAAVASGSSANKAFDYGDGGSTYSFYGVVQDGSYLYFTQELTDKKASTSTTATSLQFGAQSGSQNAAGTAKVFNGAGKWSNVPEPTSAMLLLLGVAGLALKRKAK